jgi:flagellar hook-associated protein 1
MVNGATARQVTVAGASRMADQSSAPIAVNWADSGVPAVISGGTASSALGSLNSTLPGYAAALDSVASTVAATVNAQHAAGFDLGGTAGEEFYTGSTATTLGVAITDPAKVAAAATAGGSLDGGNADALADLAKAPGGPDSVYRQVVVELGVAAQAINRRAGIQNVITQDIDAARSAQSGVNLDEEMTNLLAYQRAYEAAARVINAVDSMLDTLINRTGL